MSLADSPAALPFDAPQDWPDTSFVPADLDATSWDTVKPFFDGLLEREVASAEDMERWLLDRSELDAACSESMAGLYINMTCDTDDDAAQSAYGTYIAEFAPKLTKASFELDTRQHELAQKLGFEGRRWEVMNRDTAAAVELFREENVPLQTELEQLSQGYDQVTGAMSVEFQGQERTLPQMGKFFEESDRDLREQAWRTVSERRLQDAAKIDEIYDKMIGLRDTVGKNAGFDSYTGYAFRAKGRFDYTPEHCFAFHEAIEKHCVPFLRELGQRQKKELGVDTLRPWDTAVDPKGRPPLKPFDGGADLVAKTSACFGALDPRLQEMFATLGDGSSSDGVRSGASLDLDSRKGKAPGGYQYNRDRSRAPFIFMNAAGLHRDVETMVHEAGHAFHSMLSRREPLKHYRDYPIEIAEVASMSMELLTMPHWDSFYPDRADADRARRKQIEGSISLLPWVATIDAFQHWIYANPGHTAEQRVAHWLELDERFGQSCDWSGLEDARARQWQRQGHLFGVPFYYIEYGIAQLGALGIWVQSLEQSPAAAIDNYTAAMSLGGSRPLPELFERAGLPFDFGPAIVEKLVDRVRTELDKLPE